MPNKKPKLPDFNEMIKAFWEELSTNVAKEAQSFFKSSFDKEGFTDYGFIAWPKRRDNETHKLLYKSHALKDSVIIKTIDKKMVEIMAGEGIPYAAIHNYGGTITVKMTDKMRKYFWYMHKQTGEDKWKWMALTKKEQFSIHIPPRPFIGESHILNENIKKIFIAQAMKADQELKNQTK
ncbi:MAG: phage virion morphogenesis protein [Chitinophagales bacterium]|nr:phage virion morphogenesis protein [Chitinophagales bacterium]